MFHESPELTVATDFLLSPEAEPIRRMAESLYPTYLLAQRKRGRHVQPQPIPVLDEDFMTSAQGRWARILAEVTYSESTLRREGIDHTVVFFGSARIRAPGAPEGSGTSAGDGPAATPAMARFYDSCRELAKKLTAWSLEMGGGHGVQPFIVVTGGGPGIMEAGNRGAREAGGKTIGLNITLPHEQQPNAYITPEFNFHFHFFFTRKFHFSYRAKALVAFPGGFGTFDELFEILTLVQTRKITKPFLLVLFGKEFWNRVVNFDYLVETGMVSKEDLRHFRVIDDVEEAFQIITQHLKRFLKPGS